MLKDNQNSGQSLHFGVEKFSRCGINYLWPVGRTGYVVKRQCLRQENSIKSSRNKDDVFGENYKTGVLLWVGGAFNHHHNTFRLDSISNKE